MIRPPFLAALAGAALLAACADPAPPARPVTQAPPPPVAAAPAAPTGDGRVTTIAFPPGDAAFPADARDTLRPAIERLRANPRSVATVTSWSDRAGMDTARGRARAVRQAIIDGGIAPRRVRVVNAGLRADARPDVVQVNLR